MIKTLFRIFLSISPKFSITANLAMENLALRQQLASMIGKALSYSGNINIAVWIKTLRLHALCNSNRPIAVK